MVLQLSLEQFQQFYNYSRQTTTTPADLLPTHMSMQSPDRPIPSGTIAEDMDKTALLTSRLTEFESIRKQQDTIFGGGTPVLPEQLTQIDTHTIKLEDTAKLLEEQKRLREQQLLPPPPTIAAASPSPLIQHTEPAFASASIAFDNHIASKRSQDEKLLAEHAAAANAAESAFKASLEAQPPATATTNWMERQYIQPQMVANQVYIQPGSGDPRDLVAPISQSTLTAAATGATYSEFQLTRTSAAAAPYGVETGAGSGLDVPTTNPLIANSGAGVVGSSSLLQQRQIATYDPRAVLSEGEITLPEDVIQQVQANYRRHYVDNYITIYSADRNWLLDFQNRYSFVTRFDESDRNKHMDANTSVLIQQRLKNIYEIELLSMILPNESIDVFVDESIDLSCSVRTDRHVNAMTYPYINLHIDELVGQNFGSNQQINGAFAVLKYDDEWSSDSLERTRGFINFVPAHAGARKIFHPTLKSELQSLTFRVERPDGTLLSTAPDTFKIDRMIFSADIGSIYDLSNTRFQCYDNIGNSRYIYCRTTEYFSKNQLRVGDFLHIRNYDLSLSPIGLDDSTYHEFIDFLAKAAGHHIVGIEHVSTTGFITNGYNTCGYANIIILALPFEDPRTGLCSRKLFGGNTTQENLLRTATIIVQSSPEDQAIAINRNLQLQINMRIRTVRIDNVDEIRSQII